VGVLKTFTPFAASSGAQCRHRRAGGLLRHDRRKRLVEA